MSEKAWWTLLLLATPFLYVLTFPLVDPIFHGVIQRLGLYGHSGHVLNRAHEAYRLPFWALVELLWNIPGAI
jgi:hypothetical protein